jgi:hypothetical protein
MSKQYLEQQLELANEMENKLTVEVRPYLHDYKIAARIKRKIAKIRKVKREFESKLSEENLKVYLIK